MLVEAGRSKRARSDRRDRRYNQRAAGPLRWPRALDDRGQTRGTGLPRVTRRSIKADGRQVCRRETRGIQ